MAKNKGKKNDSAFVDFKKLKQEKGLIASIDESEDAFDRPPVPQPIVYQVKIDWQDKEEGVIEQKFKLDEDGDETDELLGYRCWLTAMIMKGEFKGAKIPLWLSTYAMRGRKTNQVHTLLVKAGVKVKKNVTQEQLVFLLRDAINSGLVVFVKIGWRGSFKSDEGKWENVIQNENGFPQKDGVFVSTAEVKHKGRWITVEAQTQIDRVYAENPDLEGDEDEDEDADEAPRVAKVKEGKKGKKVVEDDDDEDRDEDDDENEDEDEEEEQPKVRTIKTRGKKKKAPVVDDEDDNEDDED